MITLVEINFGRKNDNYIFQSIYSTADSACAFYLTCNLTIWLLQYLVVLQLNSTQSHVRVLLRTPCINTTGISCISTGLIDGSYIPLGQRATVWTEL